MLYPQMVIGIGAIDEDITGPVSGIDVGGHRRKDGVSSGFSALILGKNGVVWHTQIIIKLDSSIDRFLDPFEYWAWRSMVSHS